MDYKTSLLIYRAQTINVENIWRSKVRLIKNLTPLLRKFNVSDFQAMEDYNAHFTSLVNQVESQISILLLAKNRESDVTKINQINDQLRDLKLQYLEDANILRKQFKNDKIFELESRTKILTLLYCTWSEAVFKKLKHTPHGLSLTDRANSFGASIELQWANLIHTILNKIPPIGNQKDIDNMKLELIDISNKYIVEPSKLRNKIAHGQWTEALNGGDNTDIVVRTSLKIADLDIVETDVSFDIHNNVVTILESILESNDPDKMIISRHDSYLFLKDRLDKFISERANWNVKSRSNFLKGRSFDTRNFDLAQKLKSHNVCKSIIKQVTGVEV